MASEASGTSPAASGPNTTTTAHTEVAHGGEHHGPTLLGLDASGWVYVGVTIFILLALFVGKAHKVIANALDSQIAETKRTLEEAESVRAEAEALLADAKKQQAASAKDAKALLAHAETEAAALLVKAEADAKDMIARRTQMATDKIAAAERAAVADVRATAASAASAAAASLIASGHDAKADRSIVDATIASLN
jgi:F-type H+-transporting ATPase subunit b